MSGFGGFRSTVTEANNATDVFEFDCKPTSHTVFAILLTIITTIGFPGNAVVIYIILILKEYQKSVANVYIVQLAIADFLFLFILPFEIRTMIVGQWTYGDLWCKITESIRMLNYYASILFLTVMSIDRYLAINHATSAKFTKFRTRKAVDMISGVVWGIGFLAVILVMIHAEVEDCKCMLVFGKEPQQIDYLGFDLENGTDYYDYFYSGDSGNQSYAIGTGVLMTDIFDLPGACSYIGHYELNNWIICNFVFAFVIPLVVICACYAKIIQKVYEPLSVGTRSKTSNNTRKRVTFIVASLVLVFVLCWLPYHSFMLSRVSGNQLSASKCSLVRNLTLVFAYLSSALNPFLYTFFGTNFRKRWRTATDPQQLRMPQWN